MIRAAGRAAGRVGTRLVVGAPGRRAIARAAQIVAFAASMVATLSFAADTGSNRRLVGGAGAGTIDGALIEAYRNNPQLNAQRAATRAIDENVPTALSGYRPRVTGTSSLTEQYLDTPD
jgi:outer membrane protein TolC